MGTLYISRYSFSTYPGNSSREYPIPDGLVTLFRDYAQTMLHEDNDIAGLIADLMEESAEEAGADAFYWALHAYMANVFGPGREGVLHRPAFTKFLPPAE